MGGEMSTQTPITSETLKSRQTGLFVLLIIQSVLFAIWLGFSDIPGFTPTLNTLGAAQIWSHLCWWGIFDFIIIAFGIACVATPLPAIQATGNWWAWAIGLIIGMIAHLVHIIILAVEISNESTTFTRDNRGLAIVFIFMLVAMFVLELIMMIYAIFFYFRLDIGGKKGNGELDPLLDTPGQASQSAAIRTPLMENRLRSAYDPHGLIDNRKGK